jgi:hypothetical protein
MVAIYIYPIKLDSLREELLGGHAMDGHSSIAPEFLFDFPGDEIHVALVPGVESSV